MIESEKYNRIKEEFQDLKEENDDSEYEGLLDLFEQGINTLSKGHVEASTLCFCSVIEGVADKRRDREHKTFREWIMNEKRRNKFAEQLVEKSNLEEPNYKDVIKKWIDCYHKEYGASRNFRKVVKESYREQSKSRSFIYHKQVETGKNSVKEQVPRTPSEDFEDMDEVFDEIEDMAKIVYSRYRSHLSHKGEIKNPFYDINTKIGGTSSPSDLSGHAIADMALVVLQAELAE